MYPFDCLLFVMKPINKPNIIIFQPVYVDTTPQLYKSASCPNFTFDIEPRGPIVGRKRANSENIHLFAKEMLRIQSDTDLLGIDKEKTFTASALVKPAELLARVVNVLGGLEPPPGPPEKGIHMFDDVQILASENPPVFTIGNEIITNSPKRNRALSVAVPNYRKPSVTKLDHNVTWTNGDSPEKYVNNEHRSGKLSLPCNFIPEEMREQPKPTNWSKVTKLFTKKSSTADNPAAYLKSTMKGRVSEAQENNENVNEKPKRRGSIFPTFGFGQHEEKSEADAYKEKTKRGRHSIFPTFDFNQDDDEEENISKAYKEKTKRGRHSIFPTFDFSEDEDAAAIKAYQQKTKRHSIFPTFDFSEDEEDEAASRAYREKTRSGRRSIFPSFDFSEPEEDIAKRYKENTKRGRHSIFPTFDFSENKEDDDDDVIDEEELQRYQNRTKKGRLSLFPTFGKSKKHDQESVMPESSEELDNYKSKTKRGRGSLFPSFGKDRKSSSAHDDVGDLEASIRQYQNQTKKGRGSLFTEDSNFDADLESYRNKTKRGRGSLFDPDVHIENLPETEQVEVLEQTSVADLIRALTVLETAGQGHGGATPSLLGLLAGATSTPAPAHPPSKRRGSLRPDFILPPIPARKVDNIPSKAETSSKSENLHTIPDVAPSILPTTAENDGKATPEMQPRRRRISARAATPQFTPTLPTVTAGAELQISTATAARQNRMSMIHAPPPYSETEEPSQPRVRRYSPAPGDHGRPSTGPVPRLFSRMRRDSPNNTSSGEEGSSRTGSLTEVVIDNGKDQT